jgi:hypothetical protein
VTQPDEARTPDSPTKRHGDILDEAVEGAAAPAQTDDDEPGGAQTG